MKVFVAAGRLFLFAAIAISSPPGIPALGRSALDRVAEGVGGRTYVLKESLREPVLSGEVLQVPTLTQKGWYHQDPSGNVVLASGTRVEVTGVFDYADRGFFLELAREARGIFPEPINERPRIRVRIMVDAPIEDTDAQASEAQALIARILAEASSR